MAGGPEWPIVAAEATFLRHLSTPFNEKHLDAGRSPFPCSFHCMLCFQLYFIFDGKRCANAGQYTEQINFKIKLHEISKSIFVKTNLPKHSDRRLCTRKVRLLKSANLCGESRKPKKTKIYMRRGPRRRHMS